MPLTLEQKGAAFDKLDALVNGRAPTGKSRYFQALCRVMKELGAELKRDPAKVPPDWARNP